MSQRSCGVEDHINTAEVQPPSDENVTDLAEAIADAATRKAINIKGYALRASIDISCGSRESLRIWFQAKDTLTRTRVGNMLHGAQAGWRNGQRTTARDWAMSTKLWIWNVECCRSADIRIPTDWSLRPQLGGRPRGAEQTEVKSKGEEGNMNEHAAPQQQEGGRVRATEAPQGALARKILRTLRQCASEPQAPAAAATRSQMKPHAEPAAATPPLAFAAWRGWRRVMVCRALRIGSWNTWRRGAPFAWRFFESARACRRRGSMWDEANLRAIQESLSHPGDADIPCTDDSGTKFVYNKSVGLTL